MEIFSAHTIVKRAVFIIIGLMFASWAAIDLFDNIKMINSSKVTEGIITEIISNGSDSVRVVEYKTDKGVAVTLKDDKIMIANDSDIGKKIKVYYEDSKPENGRVASNFSLFYLNVAAIIIGLAFFTIALLKEGMMFKIGTVLVGIIILFIGLFNLYRNNLFMNGVVKTEGTIVNYEVEKRIKDNDKYLPVIEFEKKQFTSNKSYENKPVIGQKIQVYYHKENKNNARIAESDTEFYKFPFIMIIAGIGIITFGFLRKVGLAV